MLRLGMSWSGWIRRSRSVMFGRGSARRSRLGIVRRGPARRSRRGEVRYVADWHGSVRQGGRGAVWRGT